jgi:hypothetical protein
VSRLLDSEYVKNLRAKERLSAGYVERSTVGRRGLPSQVVYGNPYEVDIRNENVGLDREQHGQRYKYTLRSKHRRLADVGQDVLVLYAGYSDINALAALGARLIEEAQRLITEKAPR